MIFPDFNNLQLKLRSDDGMTSVFDPIRKKWIVLTPEEHVRQLWIQYMVNGLEYPPALIAVEKNIKVLNRNKRYDIVIYDRQHVPWMLVECKAPEVPVSENTLYQLLNYQSVVRSRYWLLTNGHETLCADARDVHNITWLNSLPAYDL